MNRSLGATTCLSSGTIFRVEVHFLVDEQLAYKSNWLVEVLLVPLLTLREMCLLYQGRS